jgi:cell division protein FtsL
MAVAQPKYASGASARPRIENPRTARTATQKRIVKNSRARYHGLMQVGAVLGLVLAGLMAYVMLTSNITSLTYSVARAQAQKDALVAETARLDDRIATMRSDERLAAIAKKLGMHDAQLFAVVRVNPPASAPSKFPVFDSIAGWFVPSAAAPKVR